MSDDQFADKEVDNDPERTLITLDQLSQTIEVMTSVVNRLRRHLSEQLQAKMAAQEQHDATVAKPIKVSNKLGGTSSKRESFVVEISQQETDMDRKSDKILH
ncbi:MAG: hypothetical protein EXR84_05995 [Gammaproteobacteria bacterium]|nr:hypothetical protein [Gammaproteobacteria bacterium]